MELNVKFTRTHSNLYIFLSFVSCYHYQIIFVENLWSMLNTNFKKYNIFFKKVIFSLKSILNMYVKPYRSW